MIRVTYVRLCTGLVEVGERDDSADTNVRWRGGVRFSPSMDRSPTIANCEEDDVLEC